MLFCFYYFHFENRNLVLDTSLSIMLTCPRHLSPIPLTLSPCTLLSPHPPSTPHYSLPTCHLPHLSLTLTHATLHLHTFLPLHPSPTGPSLHLHTFLPPTFTPFSLPTCPTLHPSPFSPFHLVPPPGVPCYVHGGFSHYP